MAKNKEAIDEMLDEVFRDAKAKQGLTFFRKGERAKLQLRREEASGRIEIYWLFRF